MNKENCALGLIDEIILYYDARSKKTSNQIICNVKLPLRTPLCHMGNGGTVPWILNSGSRSKWEVSFIPEDRPPRTHCKGSWVGQSDGQYRLIYSMRIIKFNNKRWIKSSNYPYQNSVSIRVLLLTEISLLSSRNFGDIKTRKCLFR